MIEMGKTYRTRDGREVRIYAVESHQVHGAFLDQSTGHWQIQSWQNSGAWLLDDRHPIDLIEVKPPITRTYWLVHFASGGVAAWANRANCERDAQIHPVIAITGPHEITFTEGEGLS